MTKDELQAKREVALSELKDIEVALCLDEHYIDIIEKENAELKRRLDNLFNSDCWASDQLTKAKEIIKELYEGLDKLYLSGLSAKQIAFIEQLQDKTEQFLKEIEK